MKLVIEYTCCARAAVEVFAATYEKVKTLGDVFKLFERHRSDWDKKPGPSVIPVES